MSAGKLDILVTITRKAVTSQEPTYGEQVFTWVPLAYEDGSSPQVAQKFWAELQDVLPSRSEAVQNGVSQASQQTRMRMRYRSDVTGAMRVTVHDVSDIVYEIVAGPVEVTLAGRRRVIEMMLERASTSGVVV